MSGNTAVATPLGPLDADIDVSFNDILKNLRIGGMVSYEGRNDKWVVLSDIIYMDLSGSSDVVRSPVPTQARADVTQAAIEVDGGYRLTDVIALYAGARYVSIDADLRVDVTTGAGTTRRSAGGDASWIDPVVGLLGHFPMTEKWSVDLKGDVGGFGVGSEFSWQVALGVRWQLNDSWDLLAGYRYLDVDYENEGGSGIVRYDVVTQGPTFGATWHF